MGMNRKYTGEFSEQIANEFTELMKNPDSVAHYSIEVEGDFADSIPIILANRYMNKMSNGITDDYALEDQIMHYAVKGRMIKVLLEDVVVGSFVMNGLADDWDGIPVFKEHPIAFNVLKEATTWSVIKKLTPPLKKEAGAKVAAIPQPPSNEK